MTEGNVSTAAADDAPYFAVSLFKLAVMSLFTIGLYQVYWFTRIGP